MSDLRACLNYLLPTNDEMLAIARDCDFTYFFWLGLGNVPEYLRHFAINEGAIAVKHHQLKEFQMLIN